MSKVGRKPGSTAGENEALRMEIEPQAWDLYLKGWTHGKIAEKFGMSRRVITNWFKKRKDAYIEANNHLTEQHVALELERCDSLLEILWKSVGVTKLAKWTSEKDPETGERVNKVIEHTLDRVDLDILDRILKVMERRAKYLGLDQATQVEVTHRSLEEIVLESMQPPEPVMLTAKEDVPVEGTPIKEKDDD